MNQSISVVELVKVFGIIVSIMTGVFAIVRQIASEKNKMATKEYVDQELDIVNAKIDAIDKKQTSLNDDVKYIRSRIDMLIDYNIKSRGNG